MTYGATGKSPATGYTDFNKRSSDDSESEINDYSSTSGTKDSMVKKRKDALKRRLLAMKGS